MKAYFTYFKLKFISSLQYRLAAIAGISTQFFFGFIYIMVYIAFYKTGSNQNLPMTLSQVTSYLWLNQAFLALIYQNEKDGELFKLIRDGGISYEFIRPKNLYFMWYFKLIAKRYANVILRFVPLIVVTFLLPVPYRLTLPSSFTHFLLFLFSLMIGSFLVNALITLYPILTLITMHEKGIINIITTIADILSGVSVPIAFFPKFLKVISCCLPFQYVSDLPFQTYVGSISIKESLIGIGIQFIWLILLIIMGQFCMKKILKRVVVQGG